ncbi:putative intracellular protease/amidase [Phyllobacterium sp. YR531]|nr:putative intracellular protease/amidase [Phyllobacterium sp. YR531]
MGSADLSIETRTGHNYTPRRILMVVSNPATLHGGKVGFFAEEMTAAFYAFKHAKHDVELSSPFGGEVIFDAHSDPRNPNSPYADDLVSLGFVHHAKFGELLKDTPAAHDKSAADYDAIWVAGGGAPLITFKDDKRLHQLVADFYEQGKVVALVCHGSALLLWARLSNGKLLCEGKSWTGFSDKEEDEINSAFGIKVNEYTIESEAKSIPGTRFLSAAPNAPFAVRDGRLITGQQQHSSTLASQLVLEALEELGAS